jgi:hypothetical protein
VCKCRSYLSDERGGGGHGERTPLCAHPDAHQTLTGQKLSQLQGLNYDEKRWLEMSDIFAFAGISRYIDQVVRVIMYKEHLS